jgi:hypothetical protein
MRRDRIAQLSHRETRQLSHLGSASNKKIISYCQALETAWLLRAFGGQSCGTPIACFEGAGMKSSEEPVIGGDRRRHRSRIAACRHVMASAAGAGKGKGKRV